MAVMPTIVRAIDTLNEYTGRVLAWLTLGTVLVCFLVVVLRYLFAIGSVCLQELYVWQHAIVFMLGAGYTLLHGGHVRVDILHARMSERRRAWVDLLGTIFFLMPWLVVLLWYGWPFLHRSWMLLEASGQAGGCQGYFILKSAIPGFAILLGLQGIAVACRAVLVLTGHSEYRARPDATQEPI